MYSYIPTCYPHVHRLCVYVTRTQTYPQPTLYLACEKQKMMPWPTPRIPGRTAGLQTHSLELRTQGAAPAQALALPALQVTRPTHQSIPHSRPHLQAGGSEVGEPPCPQALWGGNKLTRSSTSWNKFKVCSGKDLNYCHLILLACPPPHCTPICSLPLRPALKHKLT